MLRTLRLERIDRVESVPVVEPIRQAIARLLGTLRAAGYAFFKLDGSRATTLEAAPHIIAEPTR